MAPAEEWRPVVGFEDAYEVSNLGRVRSLDRFVICEGPAKGRYESLKRGRLLRPGAMTAGHLSVALGRGNSKCVHALVLEAFVGPCPPGHEARHQDGNEQNNRLDNLVWDTRGNNTRDKKWHKGCKNYKLKPAEVMRIKDGLRSGCRVSFLAFLFNVCESTIYAIKQGKIHTDVTRDRF